MKTQNGYSIALATCLELPELQADDQPLLEELQRRDCTVKVLPWNGPADSFNNLDAVVLRSTWDYHRSVVAFQEWFHTLSVSGTALFNSHDTLHWNIDKRYLLKLTAAGLPVIPTVAVNQGEPCTIAKIIRHKGWERIVLKPAHSLNADDTYLLDASRVDEAQRLADDILQSKDLLIQKFISEITEAGEWSLVFIDGRYSHAVRKLPKSGDFRVQKEHGGVFELQEPRADTIAAAGRVLSQVDTPWVYARVDGVCIKDQFFLMELELVEPSLFLDRVPAAATALAEAILAGLNGERTP